MIQFRWRAGGGDSRNDWRTVLRKYGQAITLSTHSRDTVCRALANDCDVSAIPVPVYERFAALDGSTARRPIRSISLSFFGRVVEDSSFDFVAEGAYPRDPLLLRTADWDDTPVQITFDEKAEGAQYLLGFYEPEPWGGWSRVAEPAILLPFAIAGKVKITLNLTAYGPNVGREINLMFGSERRTTVLTAHPSIHEFKVDLLEAVNLIRFCKLDLSPVKGAIDKRTMGVGLISLGISLEKKRRWVLPWRRVRLGRTKAKVTLSGVVFTSVLNPRDGRKNWVDILTAFCHALGDREDATLVFKMTHFSVASFLGDLMTKLEEAGPIRARVVALHGFLNDKEYRRLISATSWYVNASRGEGLCLPLMEFMSAGVPAIAPKHTAMADYVDEGCALLVGAGRMPTRWPNDPSHRLRTRYHRIEWESLAGCFSQGYEIATREPGRYSAMSKAAQKNQQAYSGLDRVMRLLQTHLERVG